MNWIVSPPKSFTESGDTLTERIVFTYDAGRARRWSCFRGRVRESQPGCGIRPLDDLGFHPGRFIVSNTPLRFVILYAYGLLDHQLIGAPDWTSSASFDITATYVPGPFLKENEIRLMVQKLFADRFGMTAHREQQELPVYSLTVARKDGRLGPQLQRSDLDCEQWIAEKRHRRTREDRA